jgi:hypothetical protein
MEKAKYYFLLSMKHATYAAAQCFAFIACKLDDLSKFIAKQLEED